MQVSVIVPCYNAAAHIEPLLKELSCQTFPKNLYEVVIIDDGSTDNTAILVKKYSVKYYHQSNKGAGASRNKGAEISKGKILLFVDSDCRIDSDWIEKHANFHLNNGSDAVLVGGVKKPKKLDYIEVADYLTCWFNVHDRLKEGYESEYFPTLNFSLKKRLFRKIGGFAENNMTGEDVAFSYLLKKKGINWHFSPKISVIHKSSGIKGYLKHNYNWGKHAPFVRAMNSQFGLNRIFMVGRIGSVFLFFPIAVGYTLFLGYYWIKYYPGLYLTSLPLLFLGKLWYSAGFIKGSFKKEAK